MLGFSVQFANEMQHTMAHRREERDENLDLVDVCRRHNDTFDFGHVKVIM